MYLVVHPLPQLVNGPPNLFLSPGTIWHGCCAQGEGTTQGLLRLVVCQHHTILCNGLVDMFIS